MMAVRNAKKAEVRAHVLALKPGSVLNEDSLTSELDVHIGVLMDELHRLKREGRIRPLFDEPFSWEVIS
jgi:hypothetical protein